MKKNILCILGIIILVFVGSTYLRQVNVEILENCFIIPGGDLTMWYSFYYDVDKMMMMLSLPIVFLVYLLNYYRSKHCEKRRMNLQYGYLIFFCLFSLCNIIGALVYLNDFFLTFLLTLNHLVFFQTPVVSLLFYLPLIFISLKGSDNHEK